MLQNMIQESVSERPSAMQIVSQPVICPATQKSKVYLLVAIVHHNLVRAGSALN